MNQLLRVATTRVSSFKQHLRSSFGQRALVRDSNSEHNSFLVFYDSMKWMTCVRLSGLEMSLNVFKRKILRDHHDLKVVEQLADFRCQLIVAFVLRGHPNLSGLFDNFLTDGVNSSIKGGNSAGVRWSLTCNVLKLGEEIVKGFHLSRLPLRKALARNQCSRN
jgi:hypothetical protein